MRLSAVLILTFLGLIMGSARSLGQNQIQKTVKEINKSLRSHSPYKGKLEVLEQGELVHYQEIYVGTRRMSLFDVGEIEYVYDRYDTQDAPHSVLLKCQEGDCATVKWVDDQEMQYSYLLFAFREKEAAEKMALAFEELRRLIVNPAK